MSEAPLPELDLVLTPGVSADDAAFIRILAENVSSGMSTLFGERAIPFPAVRVSFTDDVMGSTATESERLGLPPDRRSGAERLGGAVSGKTLLKSDSAAATILLSDQLATAANRALLAHTLAHEFGHVLYGCLRQVAIGDVTDDWLPWRVAQRLTVIAAEEFRADVLARALASALVRDGAGQPIDLRPDLLYLESMPAAFDFLVPGLTEAVRQYRLTATGLDDVWRLTVKISEEILNLVAHLEGGRLGRDLPRIDTFDHPAVRTLQPVLTPFLDFLEESPLIPGLDDFAADRQVLMKIGRSWMEVWATIGLHPRAAGAQLALWVGDPGGPPPPQAGEPDWDWDDP